MHFRSHLLRLALSLGALATLPAHAAIVSMDFSGQIEMGETFSGTLSWDTTATGTSISGTYIYTPTSFKLRIGGVDLSSELEQIEMSVSNSTNSDQIAFTARTTKPSKAFKDAASVRLLLMFIDYQGDSFDSAATPPSDLGFVKKADYTNWEFELRDAENEPLDSPRASLTSISAPPEPSTGTPTNTVPEPGSLLLASLAGLALTATRRRKPVAA